MTNDHKPLRAIDKIQLWRKEGKTVYPNGYGYSEYCVRSAVEGLKTAYVQDIVDEKKNCSKCGVYTQQHYWGKFGDSVCSDCWVDKWFPVFKDTANDNYTNGEQK